MSNPKLSPHEQLLDATRRRCVFFTGILDKVCKAGIRYEDIKAKDGKPYPHPCVKFVNNKHRPEPPDTCDKRHFPDEAETAQLVAEDEREIQAFFMTLNSGKCPYCGKDAEPMREDGDCLYFACGHRLGQGKLK